MKKRFTQRDIGCWADGTFGHDHLRAKLADLLGELDSSDDSISLVRNSLLRLDPCDDLGDEDDALRILQDHTKDGLAWLFADGDLLLVDDAETLKEAKYPKGWAGGEA